MLGVPGERQHKGSGTLPAPHPVYAAEFVLNGHHLRFRSPDSCNPWNSH